MKTTTKSDLPDHLHAACAWTDAAGELDELRDLDGDALATYCRESAENYRDEHADGSVTEEALEELHEWLNQGRITVYIDQDPASIGSDATQSDLDTYADNLAAHLRERFRRPVTVSQVLGGERAGRKCDDDAVDEYVRDLLSGDGWLALLTSTEAR